MLASDIRTSINERSRRLDWEDHCEDLDERGTDCFRRQYRMPQQTFEKTCRYTASPASTRPPFPRTLLDEMINCIHQQQREREFYRQFRTPRSRIAQPDSKIPCRYHFQEDYEMCACDVLFSFSGRPGSSEVPRNPLTRWDVSSIPANGIVLTKQLKNKIKMPNGWRTIESLVRPGVCVCFLPIHPGHQVPWTYQTGSHRRKVTQDFSYTW